MKSAAFEHCIVHRKAPAEWHDGFPLGNGEVGAMFWGNGNPLALTLDHAGLWDLRADRDHMEQPDYSYAGLQRLVAERRFSEVNEVFEDNERNGNPVGPTKISIGRAELHMGEAAEYECRLELGTALVEGAIQVAGTGHPVQAFVHRRRNVVCLRVGSCPVNATMDLIPLAEMNESLAALNHPPPLRRDGDGCRVLVQSIPDGPSYAVAWNAEGPDFLLAIETADSDDAAQAEAEATWREATEDGFDRLRDEHCRAWAEFWEVSAVYLPEPRIEFLWYYGVYLLASSSRRGSIPPGLQGVWPMDGILPPWRGDYHGDMNVQETFWPACASGHLDLLDSWCDLMRDCTGPVQEFTRAFFGTEGAFWTCSFLPRYTMVPGWHTVQMAWSNGGWLAWLVWLRWRYSMDTQWLAQTGYPVVAEVYKFYRANLTEEEDSHLHVPLSSSPEYGAHGSNAWCKDPNIDLALIRRCCDWVVEMEAALGREDLSASARDILARLVPYHLTEKSELCLWAGKPLDESHRHPSHLMAIHPAMDLTIDGGDEEKAIIHASLEQYFSLGQYEWAGHTYAQMASFGAVIGRAEFAYDCLHQFAEYWIGPNGLHFNRDVRRTGVTRFQGESRQFTMEANCGIAAGISDMLVQGWRDIVRVFPAVPAHWRDVVFRDLLTEGAFRVSAARRNGRTVWVRIVAGVARQLRLRNPFGDAPIETSGADLSREDDLLVADLKRGQEVVLCLRGEAADVQAAARCTRTSDVLRLGLR